MEVIKIILLFLVIVFIWMFVVMVEKKPYSIYENEPNEKNKYENKKVRFVYDENDKVNADGVKGHLEVIENISYKPTFYQKVIKRFIDMLLSFLGLVILSPVFIILIVLIKCEDKGPVLFVQKRVGINKQFFKLHKFRSMKMSTPKNTPTHMLKNPDEYITKIGRFMRKHSLDELPQIWDIFIGNMSIVGPRPALYNQELLIALRDEYNANEVMPGLTGYAQINGRDEISIEKKSKLDGDYVKHISFLFDAKCFFGTVFKVFKDDSVVEGGTGNK